MKIINLMWIILCLLCFVTGVWSGYVLHQDQMFKGMVMIAEGLEGTIFNVDVDINETQLVDAIHENFERMGLFNDTELGIPEEGKK